MAKPLCVACKKRRLYTGHEGRVGAATCPPTIPEARYLVYVGQSQLERFECEACQAATGNRIVVDLDSLPGQAKL